MCVKTNVWEAERCKGEFDRLEGFVLHLYGKVQLLLLVMYLIICQILDLMVCDGLKSEPKTRSDN